MATHLHRIRNSKQISPTSTPDVSKCIVVGAGAEPVVLAQGFFHRLFQTQYRHEHTPSGDGRSRPCWCGRYYAKWACGHYTAPRFITCGQTLGITGDRALQCQTPMKDIIIDNLVAVEECPNCTAFDEDAEEAFRQIDEENRLEEEEEASFDRDAEEAFQQLEEENRQRVAESLRLEGKSAD
ncbi:hypothetical protein PG984_004422 [Apiospora sp. TS-2023a]